MGAVSDVVNMGSWGRMRMWLLAIASRSRQPRAAAGRAHRPRQVVLRAAQLHLAFVRRSGVPLRRRHDARLGCGSKTLVRLGGGSLKSLVVFVFFGIAAYMTLKGCSRSGALGWIDPVAVDLAATGCRGRTCPRCSRR
jgi:hypothetical protein